MRLLVLYRNPIGMICTPFYFVQGLICNLFICCICLIVFRRKVLVTHKSSNIDITGEILQCLRPGAWLNDEVILYAHFPIQGQENLRFREAEYGKEEKIK